MEKASLIYDITYAYILKFRKYSKTIPEISIKYLHSNLIPKLYLPKSMNRVDGTKSYKNFRIIEQYTNSYYT